MFGVPLFLLDDAHKERLLRQAEIRKNLRMTDCQPWHHNMKWAKELNLVGSTYEAPYELFPEVGTIPAGKSLNGWREIPKHWKVAYSPGGEWAYARMALPRGVELHCFQGSRMGSVIFDAEVAIPAVFEKRSDRWLLWMSLTPQELFTLRPGTRAAKGHTVVGGLGMGYSVWAAAQKKSVKRITVIERSQELVDWLLPRLLPLLPGSVQVEVVIGDVYEELPKLKASVAIIDVFPSYGNNDGAMARLRRATPQGNIPKLWGWGTARLQ